MLSEEFGFNYILKRLVFVNSASHGYSEIMLDEHLAMFGNNNRGKTASLAATKLLLYPEDNFKKCESKFNFTSKSGRQYDRDESYDYYFPRDCSFLIMEIINPSGHFCMVLYRAGEFKYHRFFIPKAYEDIRYLFWDSENEAFAADLGIDALKKASKAFSGVHVTNKSDLERMMYGSFASADSQYCIVPLKDNKAASIKAFTSIFELSFNSGKGEEKALPAAIATIIEMQRGRDEEKLEANFIDLQRRYEELWEEGQNLQKLENYQDVYLKLKGQFEGLTQAYKDYSCDYHVLNYQLNEQSKTYSTEVVGIDQKLSEKTPSAEEEKKLLSSLSSELKKREGELIAIESSLTKQRDQKIKVEKYLSEKSFDLLEAQTDLQLQIERFTEQLQAIEDLETARHNLQKKQQLRDQCAQSMTKIQQNLNNISATLMARLSPHSATVLTSLNHSFMSLTGDVTDDDQEVINRFAELFHEQDGQLTFKDQSLALKYQSYDVK